MPAPNNRGRPGLQPGRAGGVLRSPLPRLDDRRRLDRDPQEPDRRKRVRADLLAASREDVSPPAGIPIQVEKRLPRTREESRVIHYENGRSIPGSGLAGP